MNKSAPLLTGIEYWQMNKSQRRAAIEAIEDFTRFAGMTHRTKTEKEWQEENQLNPHEWPGLIEISPNNKYCTLTQKGRNLINNYFNKYASDIKMICGY
jgi:hypothetical protein